MRILLFLLMTVAFSVAAQELPDSGLPDASVGQGGPEQTSEENDPATTCLDSRECAGGFECSGGRCVPTKVKNLGCSTAPVMGLLAIAALFRRPRQ